jgi:1-phosphofructokinase
MIVTFTANPSVDRALEISKLVRGAVMRATRTRVDGGGKGVNVTRALAANGCPSIAVLPSGGAEGAQLMGLLEAEKLLVHPVPIAGAIRANVTIVEPDGATTKVNEPGPALSDAEVAQLTDALLQAACGADWAVLSGSLPPGAPADWYATLTVALHDQGVNVAVDTDGAGLPATFAAAPDLVKPNQRELAQASGMPVGSRAEALAAVHRIRAAGARTVLASLGADGALLVEPDRAHHGGAEVSAQRSTVGAGDAMLAGFLAAGGSGVEALAEAVAWGTAAVSLPGSRMPGPTDLDRDAVKTTQLNTEEVAREHAHHA